MIKPYLLVTGDFVQTGGMDRANYALASYLAAEGHETHLVGYRADEALVSRPNVIFRRVRKPLGSYLLGEPLLDRAGRYWASRLKARTVVNGGNCLWGDVNWVHYVHGAFEREPGEGLLRRLKARVAHRRALATEQSALRMARVAIVNSNRTRRELIERLRLPEASVHTVYYGIDPDRFAPATPRERAAARCALGWPENRPTVAFIGGLGDRRKGFDTVYRAWEKLSTASKWSTDLAVVGAGAELAAWKARAAKDGIGRRIHFLGFRRDVPAILRACDAMVAPARYEAYGLGVQEALCCGLPALVSADAGVAERYPSELKELLIPDAEDPEDLAARLVRWRANMGFWKERILPLALELRKRTWHEMASEIVSIVDSSAQA